MLLINFEKKQWNSRCNADSTWKIRSWHLTVVFDRLSIMYRMQSKICCDKSWQGPFRLIRAVETWFSVKRRSCRKEKILNVRVCDSRHERTPIFRRRQLEPAATRKNRLQSFTIFIWREFMPAVAGHTLYWKSRRRLGRKEGRGLTSFIRKKKNREREKTFLIAKMSNKSCSRSSIREPIGSAKNETPTLTSTYKRIV